MARIDETTTESTVSYTPPAKESIAYILKLGQALHTYGSAANRLEDVLDQVAEKLNCEAHFFSTPTSIFAAFGRPGEQQAQFIRVEPGEVDLGKLADLDAVVIDVVRGNVTPAQGTERIEQVLNAPARYPAALDIAAFSVSSAAGSVFLGGGEKELLIASILGFVIGMLWFLTRNTPSLSRVFTPVAAFLASLIASLSTAWIGKYSVFTATLAGLLALIPGFMLVVAMRELSTKHLASGTARLSGAFVVFVELIFGVALGTTIASFFVEIQSGRQIQLPSWSWYAALMVAPLALTVRLRAHPRDAIIMVLSSILSVTGSRIGTYFLDAQLGVFVGALVLGVASNLYARIANRPSLIPWVPGLLLLVPGSIGLRGLALLINEDVVVGVESAFKMIMIAVGLVAGTLIANVIIQPRKLT